MKNKCLFGLAAAALAAASPAAAWGPVGHTEVGRVADGLLTGNARRHVRRLIGMPLATAGPWADCLRDVKGATGPHPTVIHDPHFAATCGPFWKPANAAREQGMIDYVRRNTDNCTRQASDEACHLQYHFEDIALQRPAYGPVIGTNDHDIVNAARAAIAVLEGRHSPPPFAIANKKEALLLLAHVIGDLHQPLHVGAVYLDTAGNRIDPGAAHPYDPGTFTRGGNFLFDGSRKLHGEWDGATAFPASGPGWRQVLTEARALPATPGAPDDWPEKWANETLGVAQTEAFGPLTFAAQSATQHWNVRFPPPATGPGNGRDAYMAEMAVVQRRQVERAGVRLARILNTIWPGA
jgi:hypothetical protein